MTKAEKQNLHAVKCIVGIDRVNMGDGPETLYTVSYSLTEHQLTEMSRALANIQGESELYAFLKLAAIQLGIQL